jgi:hypothetical protein
MAIHAFVLTDWVSFESYLYLTFTLKKIVTFAGLSLSRLNLAGEDFPLEMLIRIFLFVPQTM